MTCPRCFGLMVPESDYHGEFRTCMACGYVSYPEPVDITPVPSGKTERMIGRGRRRYSAPPVR